MELDEAGEPSRSPGDPEAGGPPPAEPADGPTEQAGPANGLAERAVSEPATPGEPAAFSEAVGADEPGKDAAASDPANGQAPRTMGDQAEVAAPDSGGTPSKTVVPPKSANGTDEPPAGPADEPPAPAKKSRTGRNLPAAIGVGVVLGGMVLLSLYTVKVIFLVVMAVFLLLGLREMTEAFKAREIRVPLLPLAAGLLAAAVGAYWWGAEPLLAITALTVLAVLVWRMADGPTDGYVRDVTAGVFITGYVVLMGGIVALLMAPHDGDDRIVIFIATTVASDIGGYFAGTFLGRHKLVPSISPKKTWEGAAGSIITCMLIGGWLVWWLLDDGQLWQGAIIGAAAAVVAIAGDLIVSMIKRDLGLKDMGNLLPGHGGVMDRLDSLIATAPVVWVLLEIFVPAG